MKSKLDRGNLATRGVTRVLFWPENIPRVLLHPLAASWKMSEGVVLQGVNCRDADFSRKVKRLAARRALQRPIGPLRELGNRTECPADRVRTAKCENVMCVPSVRSAMMILVTGASGGRSRERTKTTRSNGLPLRLVEKTDCVWSTVRMRLKREAAE